MRPYENRSIEFRYISDLKDLIYSRAFYTGIKEKSAVHRVGVTRGEAEAIMINQRRFNMSFRGEGGEIFRRGST